MQYFFDPFFLKYSLRKERDAAAKYGLPVRNKMLLEEDDELLVHEVNHSVRQLCKTIDAFIFVVDSSTSKDKGNITFFLSWRLIERFLFIY